MGSRYVQLAGIFFVSICIIAYRFYIYPVEDVHLQKYEGKKITLCGQVFGEPTKSTYGTKFVLHIFAENCEGEKVSYVQVNTSSFDPGITHGAKIKVEGKLTKPEEIDDGSGRVFDYPNYLKKDGIYFVVKNAKVVSVVSSEQFSIRKTLYDFKQKCIASVEALLPVPHSFLATGLVISGKGSMSKDLQEEFQRVGLIHIVVLSGSNVSIIGEVIVKIFSFLPRVLGALFGGLGVVLFSLMVGGSATVVRSTVMSLIAIFARLTGRTNSALISLTVAGVLMLFWNPLLVLYDPSFQLSFLASIGLILYAPRIEEKLSDKYTVFVRLVRKKSELNVFEKSVLSIVSSSLGTQITTLPIILKISGLVSVVSLPVNILLLPLIPYTMLVVCISGVLGFISQTLATIPAYVSWIFLEIILSTVHVFSGLNFAAVSLGVVSTPYMIGMYSVIFAEYMWHVKRKHRSSF